MYRNKYQIITPFFIQQSYTGDEHRVKDPFSYFHGYRVAWILPNWLQDLAAKSRQFYDWYNFPNLKLSKRSMVFNSFRSLHQKVRPQINFTIGIFAAQAPYPKCPPSVKHWAGCHGFQCLPAILCIADPVGQKPQRPTPAPAVEIRHTATKIHKVYGLWLKNLGLWKIQLL